MPNTGLQPTNLTGATIYPNPVAGTIHVAFSQLFEGTLSLYNAFGVLMHRASLMQNRQYDIASLSFADGFYYLVFRDQSGTGFVQKLQVKN